MLFIQECSVLFKRLLPYAVIYFTVQLVLRLSLLTRSWLNIDFEPSAIVLVLVKGLWFDLVATGFVLIPIALYLLFLPARKYGATADRITDKILRFVFAYIVLFGFIAEHLFWSEFTTRFNFIAVDYLVYTQEVIGNIVESYPLYWLLTAIGIAALVVSWISLRLFPHASGVPQPTFSKRSAQFAGLLAVCGVFYAASNIEQAQIKGNAEASEVATNGLYNLFYAFWHNEISYDRFYAIDPEKDVIKTARNLLLEKDGETFTHNDGKDLTRLVKKTGAEKHKNVMLVVMESMSANYMGAFGNTSGLTPNLDRLSREGIAFTNTYATGTRTVRGLEAVTLSIPPTPGQSIIRRPDNENLFSLGFVFKDRGYDTKFIYGGYGYFDNMNTFFAGNGFDIVDRTNMNKEEMDFANIWGICDEDMFNRAIKEADQSFASGKPFLHLVMTTSNHRPYTYPEGRIDIASGSNRLGGVKYADYSVGKLIEDAKTKPWFKDTIFIFVADHTAGAGGKAELNPEKYHIPMIFYAPQHIKPQHFGAIASQIDLPTILLGMLNFSYYSKFYGEDLLHDSDEIGHAFISNFQKVALIKSDELTVLAPKRKIDQFTWPAVQMKKIGGNENKREAVAYYQSASWWREEFKRIPTVVK